MLTPARVAAASTSERGLLVAVMGTAATCPGILDVYDVQHRLPAPEAAVHHPVRPVRPRERLLARRQDVLDLGVAAAQLRPPSTSRPAQAAHDLPRSSACSTTACGSPTTATRCTSPTSATPEPASSILDRPACGSSTSARSRTASRTPRSRCCRRLTWPRARRSRRWPSRSPATGTSTSSRSTSSSTCSATGSPTCQQGPVGAARIINVDDPRHPYVVLRHPARGAPAGDASDERHGRPGRQPARSGATPPTTARCRPATTRRSSACSMILSGLRLFDIRDVEHPREVAYFNKPCQGD